MAAIGEVIDDKYEILKLIGRGGMSRVYLAMDKRLNKQWAVKEIEKRARDKNNEVVIQSAIAEANMIKKLDHPALPRIVDIIDNGNVICVVMDYIEGEPLSKILEREGAQPEDIVIEWAQQLCEVLDYLHTRTPPIIYRDMKPANIMLRPDGKVKLIDFGIAREYKEHNLADTVNLGTKGYAAPEQFGKGGQTDARTDVYCLGVTLYHLVTGHNPAEPPYEIYPIRHWDPQLSEGLEVIIQKCVQQTPENRYQSCAELIYALQHYEEYGEEYRQAQRNKLKAFIATLSASVLTLSLGFGAIAMRNRTNNSDYNQNIIWAEKESDTTQKVAYYAQAVEIKPLEMEAYMGMIDAFKDDAAFTLDEEAVFKKSLNANITELRNESTYSELAFEIGKLYWYYYDYGKEENSDNQVTRMKSSIQWFDDVVSYGDKNSDEYKVAIIYRNIGQFNRDVTLNIEEASDKGTYKPYWDNIEDLVSMILDDNESEIVQLEVCRLAMNAIENYARKFKADGITKEEMQQIYDSVFDKIENIQTNSDKTDEIKQELIDRSPTVQRTINNTFES